MPRRPGTATSADDEVFVKRRADAPAGFFAAEAAGLAWLARAVADGGAQVADVLGVSRHEIRLRRLHPAPPTAPAAERFGRALAVTHRHGAPGFGAGAPGAEGLGWIGPLPLPVMDRDRQPPLGESPLDMAAPDEPSPGHAPTAGPPAWGAFYATRRLDPFLRLARDRGGLDRDAERVLRTLGDRLAAGDAELTGPPEPVSRLHGDLWSGNVLWTSTGAVLIDPSAHGGHRESDLAMLALFGAPHLERILAAYDEAWPLAPGWRQRVGLHQLYPLLVHAALFGSSYGAQAVAVARRYA